VKSEWEFQFSTHGFRFDREYKYRMKIGDKVTLENREPELIEPLIRIVPSDHEPFPDTDQIGSMFVLLPYSPEETREFAFYCATTVAERISFTQGDFRIFGGVIFCKRMPETPEEEAEIGDSPYGVEMRLIEDLSPETFDSSALQSVPSAANRLPLIAQFNEAKRIKQPIAKFIGFFKIIESLTHATDENRRLKAVLLGSTELRRIYSSVPSRIDFESFVERASTARHNCAHLKINKDFGYTPLDSAVKLEVEPLLATLEMLASASISQWQEAGA
jgi:hypothetical protein